MAKLIPGRNPLALIAIFAGTIEASALASLPLLESAEKQIYVWFLVGFPPFLTLLFFITLNFNHRALFAPGKEMAAGQAKANEREIFNKVLQLDYKFSEPMPEVILSVSQALELIFQQQCRSPASLRSLKVDIHA